LTANKSSLLTQIETALARDNANVSANLINIAQIFAQLDQRLAAMETKLERILAERPSPTFSKSTLANLPSARAEELIALIDERVKIALERAQHQHLEAVAGVARDVLGEFVGEFRQLCSLIEGKLVQTPFDPAARERTN
jgi:hypothetical protein